MAISSWRSLLALALRVGAAAAIASSAASAGAAEPIPPVIVVSIDGPIGPATAELVQHALERSVREQAQLVILRMDTPGGLDTAMREIVRGILASPVPVAGFVSPQGARAASAGTYILYATHVAAMSPATNLGAATPIAIGLPTPDAGNRPAPAPAPDASAPHAAPDTLSAKRVNDATAYIRSLAQLRGRNAAWAEQAVREAVSLPAGEALEAHVIDLVAVDLKQLLQRLDGRKVQVGGASGRTFTLATAAAPVIAVEPDWRGRLMAAIGDPSLALILLMIGVYGLLFEFMSPGMVAPGVVGGVCLLLALWGLQMLPVNYAGAALVLLGLAFFVAEAFIPSYGMLGMGGGAAVAFGALMLVDTDIPGFGVPLPVVALLVTLSAGFVFVVAGMAARARRRPVVSGAAMLVGASGDVIEAAGDEGWALVAGERWRVRCALGLRPGQSVRVERVDGLTLEVAPRPVSPLPQGVLP